jgi:hypothetical protein
LKYKCKHIYILHNRMSSRNHDDSLRNHRKAFVHSIDWEKDIIYYESHIEEAGFEGILQKKDDMGMDIDDLTVNPLGYLFTSFIDNPIANANFSIFYDVLMDILSKRSKKRERLLRGDIIHLNFIHDTPQEGYFFWDGSSIIRGDINHNGKYTVPKQFKIFEEFPPNYWDRFPCDKFLEESVVLSKGFLRTSEMRMYLLHHTIFTVQFQSERYMIVIEKSFTEKIMDSEESKIYVCSQQEIPNYIVDFLRSQGLDSSTIYDRTICIQSFDEDELCQMIDEMEF